MRLLGGQSCPAVPKVKLPYSSCKGVFNHSFTHQTYLLCAINAGGQCVLRKHPSVKFVKFFRTTSVSTATYQTRHWALDTARARTGNRLLNDLDINPGRTDTSLGTLIALEPTSEVGCHASCAHECVQLAWKELTKIEGFQGRSLRALVISLSSIWTARHSIPELSLKKRF